MAVKNSIFPLGLEWAAGVLTWGNCPACYGGWYLLREMGEIGRSKNARDMRCPFCHSTQDFRILERYQGEEITPVF